MSYNLHCVSQIEEYDGNFFNHQEREIANLINELCLDVWWSEDRKRCEIVTSDYEQMIESIDAKALRDCRLFTNPTEEDVEKVRQAFQFLCDKADKSLGCVILVWY